MKEYLVKTDNWDWENMWLVLANSASDANDKVYKKYLVPMNENTKLANEKYGYQCYEMYYKKELEAILVHREHKEYGDVVCIH